MTLYEELKEAMERVGDSFENKVCKLSDEQLKSVSKTVGRFGDYFHGFPKWEQFLCWGENHVYSIVTEETYKGGEDSLVSFPRNPGFTTKGD